MKTYKNIVTGLVLVIFLSGCILGKRLSMEIGNNLKASYHLMYNNRTAKHKPAQIVVVIDSLNTKNRYVSVYRFDITSDKVEKYSYNAGKKENYILFFDSTIAENKNFLSGNGTKTSDEIVCPVTPIESTVFQKTMHFSDSLKLKNFSSLNRSKGFTQVFKSKKITIIPFWN
jgi:hypothetical protein